MNTHLKQIFTIVGFFSLSIGTTLVISWGMTNLLYQNELEKVKPVHTIILHKTNTQLNLDFTQSFKLLIPKLTK